MLHFICLLSVLYHLSVADYVRLTQISFNSTTPNTTHNYPINSQSCPIGRVCDYLQATSTQLQNMIQQCNSTVSTSTNIQTAGINCYNQLYPVLAQLQTIYQTGSSSGSTLRQNGSILYLVLALMSMFHFQSKSMFILLLIISSTLIPTVKASEQKITQDDGGGDEGGDGGSDGFGDEGNNDGGGDSSGNGGGDSCVDCEIDNGEEYVTPSGFVEMEDGGDGYYFNSIAVSSRSYYTNYYIVSLNMGGNVVSIADTCLLTDMTNYISQDAVNCQDIVDEMIGYLNETSTLDETYTQLVANLTNCITAFQSVCISSGTTYGLSIIMMLGIMLLISQAIKIFRID